MPFFGKDYYKADLNRVCDAEEIVSEWYSLDIYNPKARDQMLTQHGFTDLLKYQQDWRFIANQFRGNLVLENVFVGGIDLRMLKLELRAQIGQEQYYQLLDSWVKVSLFCKNEVKRKGYVTDIHVKPKVNLRQGDVLVAYLKIAK